MNTDALFKLNILAQHYLIALLYFFLISFSPVILRSRYEKATPNLCWVFFALLGVLCS